MEKEKLIELIEKGLSSYQISKEFCLSQTTIAYWLKKFGLRTKYACKRKGEKYTYIGKEEENTNEKLCRNCNLVKPLSEFYLNKERGKHLGNCKECCSEINKKYNEDLKTTERYIKIANSIDWGTIQKDHNNGLAWYGIVKKYHISAITLNRAEKEGRIKKIKHGASNERKIAISKGRKKYLSENPDKHWWKNKDRFKSKPCEYLKQKLSENGINFIPEHQPLENRFFSIDIAFPDKKIGIEVNGNQHYNQDKTLKPYYQKRKELIEQEGWKIFDIYFIKVYDKKFINDLILELKSSYKLENIDYSFYIKKKKKKEIDIEKINKRKEEKLLLIKEKKELVLNSGIDFSKLGWAKMVGLLLNVKSGGR